MRRTLLSSLALVTTLVAVPSASAVVPKPRPVCHWVKATRKVKRHKVCVKKRVPAKTSPAGVPATAPSSAPGAPVAPAPFVASPIPAPGIATAPSAGAPVSAFPAAPTPAPARVQVTAREFSLTLSRASVAAGSVIVQLVNGGEDPHDLHLRRAGDGADVVATDVVGSGDVADLAQTPLPAGNYTLYCSLTGHEQLGMHVDLSVR
jgi:hypothetical protein